MRFFGYVVACWTVVLFMSGAALAKNDKDHSHGHKNSDIVWQDQKKGTIAIGAKDRDLIQSYLKRKYARKCPPGLAKKHNGCLPPGIAKKYQVGYPLDSDVAFSPIAEDLLSALTPAPRGYQYVQVDKDILLISAASKKVLDAVTLLSAVGN